MINHNALETTHDYNEASTGVYKTKTVTRYQKRVL